VSGVVRVESVEQIAVLTLDRPRANAFDPELVTELGRAFREAANTRAIVLTSSQSLFSAGWDLKRVIAFDRAAMEEFVRSYCDLVREIFACARPVVAALPGHAIAGGLIVAAAADERIAADGKAAYGLSEVALGVAVPACLLEVFRHLLGPRGTERLAATGENLSGEAARSVGLLDRLVPAGELHSAALERARALAGRPLAAYGAIKLRVRAAAIARYDQARDRDPFLDFWFGEDAQQRLRALVAKLEKNASRSGCSGDRETG
jgi:enoyl-CoA hydratase